MVIQKRRELIFAQDKVWVDAQKMPGYLWWEMYGGQTPELQHVAIWVLSVSVTSSACESNWSTYGYVHSDTSNSLNPKTAKKLVYAYFNSKFLREQDKFNFENDYFLWDADEPAQDE